MDTFLFEQSEADGTKMIVVSKIVAFGLSIGSKDEATVWVNVGTYTYSKDMPCQQAAEWTQELNKIVQKVE